MRYERRALFSRPIGRPSGDESYPVIPRVNCCSVVSPARRGTRLVLKASTGASHGSVAHGERTVSSATATAVFCLCVVAVVIAADAGLDSVGRKISTLLLFAGEVLAHRSVRLLLSPARATMLARQKAIRIPLKLAKSSFRYRSSSGNLTTLINMKLD